MLGAQVFDKPMQLPSTPIEAPPRTLLVTEFLHLNGATIVNLELARRWPPAQTLIAVLKSLPRSLEVGSPSGVRIEYLTSGSVRMRWALLTSFPRLTVLARKSEVVLSASEIGFGLLAGYCAARIARRPFVIAVHADLDRAIQEWVPAPLHRLFYWLHRHADGAICVAHGLEEPLIQNGLAKHRIRIIRNGIDTIAIRRRADEPSDFVFPDVPIVVTTGRLSPQKGYDLLLQAHAKVVKRFPHQIIILNDGPERAALGALANQLGISATVQFAGAVAKPMPILARADLFCLPSRHEGLSLALLEAIVLGVPIIAADCSDGVRTALDDGRIGDLIPVGDVSALAQSLEKFFSDRTALQDKARCGPQYAEQFDSQVMAQGWARALRELSKTHQDP